jgi:hypothetical protein
MLKIKKKSNIFLNKYGYQTQNLLDLFIWEREYTFKNHGEALFSSYVID